MIQNTTTTKTETKTPIQTAYELYRAKKGYQFAMLLVKNKSIFAIYPALWGVKCNIKVIYIDALRLQALAITEEDDAWVSGFGILDLFEIAEGAIKAEALDKAKIDKIIDMAVWAGWSVCEESDYYRISDEDNNKSLFIKKDFTGLRYED